MIIERINKDISSELIEEHKKLLGQHDTSNSINSSICSRYEQNNIFKNSPSFFSKRLESCLKSYTRDNSDHIENVIIYELYNEDRCWDNMYALTGDVLEALTDELIIQHIKQVAKCFISR